MAEMPGQEVSSRTTSTAGGGGAKTALLAVVVVVLVGLAAYIGKKSLAGPEVNYMTMDEVLRGEHGMVPESDANPGAPMPE